MSLAVQGANESLSPSDRNAIALQVKGLRDQLISLANTKGDTGYLFAGTKTDTQPFDPTTGAFLGNDGATKVAITDGVVTDAWTEAAMFRGFEIILRGKDPQAGLIMTPRICGICGGSHLYKACYALDTAWATYVPPNATRVRNIAQACETLQSIPRWFYAIMGPDLTAAQYADKPLYEEVGLSPTGAPVATAG